MIAIGTIKMIYCAVPFDDLRFMGVFLLSQSVPTCFDFPFVVSSGFARIGQRAAVQATGRKMGLFLVSFSIKDTALSEIASEFIRGRS